MNIRDEFPQIQVGKVYFDSAASALKPLAFIHAMTAFYSTNYSTVHRSAYALSQVNSQAYESVRLLVAKLINVKDEREIVFTKNTTEAINLVASCFAEEWIKKGDRILLSDSEHHSNLVCWQVVAKKAGAHLDFIKVDSKGGIDPFQLKKKLTKQTKIASFAYASNVFGYIQPIKEIAKICRGNQTKILVDGAQVVSFLPIDVEDLGIDFFTFSAHKLYGPTGLGILWGRYELLDQMPPFLFGGDMIEKVTLEKTTYNQPPLKFEAGTPPVAEVLGLKAVLEWIGKIGIKAFYEHAITLRKYAIKKLRSIDELCLINDLEMGAPILTFHIKGFHPLDLAILLDQKGFQLRSGHLCAQTAMKALHQTHLCRISFGIYNTFEEIDHFCDALLEVLAELKSFSK